MPRVSREQTESNRLAIEAASSRLFRERGIKNVSVADLMASAGLTHGGFYGHFDSKDALAAQVCASAFEASAQRWRDRAQASADRAGVRGAIVEGYLSKKSRDLPGHGCPATTLATDVSREPVESAIRTAFVSGLERLIDELAALQGSADAQTDRAQALADLSMLAGAQLLARATIGSPLSDELLVAAKRRLLSTQAALSSADAATSAKKPASPRRRPASG